MIASSTDTTPRMVGHNGSLEWLRAGSIHIDREYQRYINKNRVDAIAANYDPDVFGVLICSRRVDGNVFDLDGQHRLEAAMIRFGQDALVPCFVMNGLDQQQEASIFWKLNRHRLQPSSADTFRARLAANEPIATAIATVAHEYDVEIQLYPQPLGPNQVGAFSALESIYRDGLLPSVFDVLRSAWPNEPGALRAHFMLGLQTFFRQFYREFFADEKNGHERMERLVSSLSTVTPRDIERRAATYREGLSVRTSTAVARAIYWHYSFKIKSARIRLPTWGLDDAAANRKLVELDGE